jgi:two-component sensor histidine kinase
VGRALPVYENGQIVRWIGTCTDIHEAKAPAEQNEVLNRELSHRIKNIFAVVAGLVELTARDHKLHLPICRELVDSVVSLGRAHNFARPNSEESHLICPRASFMVGTWN